MKIRFATSRWGLVFVAALPWILIGCGGGKSAADERFEVREAVRGWVEAGRTGDRQGFLDRLSIEDREAARAESYVAMIQESPGLEYSVSDVRVDGDAATVRLSLAEGGQIEILELLLAREEGDWKIREKASLELLADSLRRELMPMLDDIQNSGPGAGAGSAPVGAGALSEVLGGSDN